MANRSSRHRSDPRFDAAYFNVFEQVFDPQGVCDFDAWDWLIYANCTDTDPEAFFADNYMQKHVLVDVCANCSVTKECLDFAVKNDVVGWWAGTTRQQRRAMAKQQEEQRGDEEAEGR